MDAELDVERKGVALERTGVGLDMNNVHCTEVSKN